MRLGIDIGGTTVKIGLINNYKIIKSFSIDTKPESLFDDIFELLISHDINLNELEQIGFGIPGNVSNNYINKMPNIGLSNIDLNKIAKKYTNTIIKSSNDANCAALGEAINYNIKSAYFITLGTGVGGGLILDGKVIEGAHNSAGEVGHIAIDKHNFKCTCGLFGCIETVASATGIKRLAQEYKDQYKTNIDFSNLSAKDVIDSARTNDELGLFVLNYVAKSIAKLLSILAVSVDVDTFIIGGGVSYAGDILLNSIKKYYKEYSFYGTKKTNIKLAELKNDAGMIGAAYL